MAKRAAAAGIFAALALICSYVESFIPFQFGVPGIKLGLANIVVVTALYFLPVPEVCFVAFLKILLSGLLFGNLMSLIYSFAGGILSLAVMMLLKKTRRFSVFGVSAAGGVFHNIGQIAAAQLLTGVWVISYYLPVLMGAGILTGCLIGLVSGRILKILKDHFRYSSV